MAKRVEIGGFGNKGLDAYLRLCNASIELSRMGDTDPEILKPFYRECVETKVPPEFIDAAVEQHMGREFAKPFLVEMREGEVVEFPEPHTPDDFPDAA